MRVDSVFNTALRGVNDSVTAVDRAAARIAGTGVGDNIGGDLVADIVDMKLAQRSFEANIKVMMTAEDMEKEILSMF